MKTMGGKNCWEVIRQNKDYRLQRHLLLRSHCRILDRENRRIASGSEAEMLARYEELDRRTLCGISEPPHKRYRTMGGAYWWETVRFSGIYRLQRHKLFSGCRILDLRNVCVDYGPAKKMLLRFQELQKEAATMKIPAPGDVIGVKRTLYDHYGVYVSDGEVIEFSAHNPEGKSIIQKTTFAQFLGESKECFYLVFGDTCCEPGKVYFSPAVRTVSGMPQDFWQKFRIFADSIKPAPGEFFSRNLGDALSAPKNYRLRSPEETIRRARAQLGKTSFGESEKEYSLHRNNCEHFAIWCKTGVMMSTQAEGYLMHAFRIAAAAGQPEGEQA